MNNQNLDYDIIIVGAGPAGSTAGYLLSKIGLKALLIDKDVFPRLKLCGGILSLKTIEILNKIFSESILSLQNKRIIDYNTPYYEINYNFEKIFSYNASKFPFYFVEREIYDNFILEKAKSVGTEVIEGTKVKKINLDSREIFLENGDKIKSRYIIGADGANSVVRNEFISKNLINSSKWQDNLATGLECLIPRNKLKDNFSHPILSFGLVKYGYSWVFPNKNKIIVGVGGLNKKNKGTFKSIMKIILHKLKLDPNIISTVKGHPIPYGNFKIKPVYKNKVFLIGDAGGFVDPLWGEGIYYAHRTAQLVSLAISKEYYNRNHSDSSYLQLLQKYIYSELNYAIKLRKFFFSKMNVNLKYNPLKFAIKIFEKQFLELINGVRSYKWLMKKKE